LTGNKKAVLGGRPPKNSLIYSQKILESAKLRKVAKGGNGVLNFAVYGKLLLDATKETDVFLVNSLMDSIVVPLSLTAGKDNELLSIDRGTVARYLKGERNIHQKIMLGSKEKKVLEKIEDYFEKNILNHIIPAMMTDLLDGLTLAISNDETIPEKKKEELLSNANKDNLAIFLSDIFLYVVNRPNDNGITVKLTEHNNLPTRNRFFSGRKEQLESVNKLFKKKDNNAVNICQTVSGLGGIGKTQLAIEYAYRYCGSFRNCIWFINAETTTTTQNYFVDFADHLKLSLPPDFKPNDLQIAVKLWLNDNKDWLLIFDNLESADVIKPYLPDNINGRMIITTRNTRIDFGSQIALGVFNMDEAMVFLRKRLSNDEKLDLEFYVGSANDFEAEAPNLAKRLGFLPLALEQAVAYIKEVKCTITKYLQLFEKSGLAALEEKQALPEHYVKEVKESDFEKIVTATWSISFDAIALEGAKQLLNLCAYMAPDKIPVAFFAEMRDKLPSPIREDMAEDISKFRIVTELRTYSLTSGDADYINVHRLVQEVVRKSHAGGI